MKLQILCDFDGTIALQDTTDLVLSAYAHPDWETIEEEWKSGLIGSAECMRRQIELVDATSQEIDALLDTVDIDPHFAEFAAFCGQKSLPLLIVSDGVDYFIRRILARTRLAHLPIRANRLIHKKNGRYTLGFPHAQPDCASRAGHCKCALADDAAKNILIGDGQSDFCLAHQADLVIAKKRLLEYSSMHALRHVEFAHFGEVQTIIARLIAAPSHEHPHSEHASFFATL